jgi:hypothetical protein
MNVPVPIGWLAPLVVLLGSALSCSDSQTPPFVYDVEEGASQSDVRLIKDVSEDAWAYYERKLDWDFQGRVIVRVVLDDSLSRPSDGARDSKFFLGSPRWSEAPINQRKLRVAREAFNNFIFDLAGPPAFAASPGWLREGAADWAAARFLDDEGDRQFDESLAEHELAMSAKTIAGLIPVHPADFSLSFVAVSRLLANGDFGPLRRYLVDLREMDWRSSFRKNFGISPEAFIEDFQSNLRK